jgi:hypothetical protein
MYSLTRSPAIALDLARAVQAERVGRARSPRWTSGGRVPRKGR